MHETNNYYFCIFRYNSSISNNLSLRSILDANKLTGTNFLDWYRNLRIILKQEKRLYVIDQVVPDVPNENASDAVKNKYNRYIDDNMQAAYVILASMSSELQKQYENIDAHTIIFHVLSWTNEFNIDLVLQLLPPSYAQFIMNFNMHKLDVELPELMNILVTAKKSLKKEKVSVLLVYSSKAKKKEAQEEVADIVLKPTGGIKKDEGTCHHCGREGY
ncbi:uncharacterized protein LOC110603991 [Manihot esculenta]|uniref:uncharacterized protein LOC110603991 n=1 Tax=Manihot esculenta TaxID=3983 RepID=UPI000B5D6E5F|nr:uncharacterized protein LOC110603991 [Manihot esculenta]